MVRCDQPAFSTYTCFDPANIAELITAIGEVKGLKKKDKKKIISKVTKIFSNPALQSLPPIRP